MNEIKGIKEPPEIEGGDFVSMSGLEHKMNIVIRVLFMRPGELLHEPDTGGGLLDYGNKPMTDENIQAAVNRARLTLASLEFIDSFNVVMYAEPKKSRLTMDLTISVGGASLTRRNIIIEE